MNMNERRNGVKRTKKIALEEHWANQELNDLRTEWGRERDTPLPSIQRPSDIPSPGRRTSRNTVFLSWTNWHCHAGDFNRLPRHSGVRRTRRPPLPRLSKSTTHRRRSSGSTPDALPALRACPPEPEAAADEFERAVKELGFKGAMIQGSTGWEYLDESKYWVIWERAEALDVPIYLHVQEPSFDTAKLYEGHPELTGATWAWGVETGTHALRIINAGVFRRIPQGDIDSGTPW